VPLAEGVWHSQTALAVDDELVATGEKSHPSRASAHANVAPALASLSDSAVRGLIDAGTPLGFGIGGASTLLDVDGVPVFVKRLPLTDLERLPANERSTANVFRLPVFCHYGNYGIGGPGFGAWRELAAQSMTTEWVLDASFGGFPLLYHSRVLTDSPLAVPEELADVDSAVAFFGGASEVRDRIEALRTATASVTLFLEYFPQNALEWLSEQVTAGDDAVNRACHMLDGELERGIAHMNRNGLVHFDTHLENVLTDGSRLYFTDFGLALASSFDLFEDEATFLGQHQSYDRGNAAAHLVHWLATFLCTEHGVERESLLEACAKGEAPAWVPEAAAAILLRQGPLAAAMVEFTRLLRTESVATPYPFGQIQRLQR
jgi:hypothetical protein